MSLKMTFPCKLTRNCGLYFWLLDCLNTSRLDKYYDVSIKNRQAKNTLSENTLSGDSKAPQFPRGSPSSVLAVTGQSLGACFA